MEVFKVALNLKNLKNFKKGVKEMTPEQKIGVTMWSGLGGFIGMCIAFVAMMITIIAKFDWQMFGFLIVVACAIPMLWMQFSGSKKQIEQIKKIKEQFKDLGDKNV